MASKFKPTVDLLGLLDKQLVESNGRDKKYKTPRPKPHIWPTEASVQWEAHNELIVTEGPCLRACYYRLNNYPVTDDPVARMHWVWQAGTWWEKECNKLSHELGILAAKSTKIQDASLSLTISGEMDAVNFYTDAEGKDHFYVIDYKTTGGSYQNQVKLMGNSKNAAFPKVENLLQLMVYLYQDPKLEFGMLVYNIRDKMERVQFEIRLKQDPETGLLIANVNGVDHPEYSINEIYRRYRLLCDYYDRQVLPPRDYDFEYTDDKAKKLSEIGEVSDSALKKHLSGSEKAGSWQCIAEDTLIRTVDNSWALIQSVKKGDFIQNGNKSNRVLKFLNQGIKDNIVLIKPYLLMDYKATEDHKISASFIENEYYNNWRLDVENKFDFYSPREILDNPDKKWYVKTLFSNYIDESINLSDDELFALAFFMTEGNYRFNEDDKCYKISITNHLKEREIAEKYVEIALKLGATSGRVQEITDTRLDKPRTYLRTCVYGVQFVNWLKKYIHGRYSYNKYFDNKILNMAYDKQKKLIEYMMRGDGAILYMRTSIVDNYSTTSRVLALQVQEMYLRNNMISSIVRQKGKIANFGHEKDIQTKDAYHVRYFRNTNHNKGWISGNELITKLNKIEILDEQLPVYDLSIEDNPWFVTQGGLVHNCSYCNFRKQCELDGET